MLHDLNNQKHFWSKHHLPWDNLAVNMRWLRDWIMHLTVMQQLPRVALLILSNSFCKNWLRRLLTAFILNPKSWNQLDSLDGLALIRFNGFTYHQCRPAIILHLVCLIRIEMAQWFERNMTWEMDGLAICSCIHYTVSSMITETSHGICGLLWYRDLFHSLKSGQEDGKCPLWLTVFRLLSLKQL